MEVPEVCALCGKPFTWWQLRVTIPTGTDAPVSVAHRGCAIDKGYLPKLTIL